MVIRKVPPVKLFEFPNKASAKVEKDTPVAASEQSAVLLTQEEKLRAHKNVYALARSCNLGLGKLGSFCHSHCPDIQYRLTEEKAKIPKVALEVLAKGLGLSFDEMVSPELKLTSALCERVKAVAKANHLHAYKQGNFNRRNRGDL